ncbi:MAG: hypothetical protein K1X83_06740 [Oligoflexia bacterium]|nr:hypothetical protein [Oligoflexia bacterium]
MFFRTLTAALVNISLIGCAPILREKSKPDPLPPQPKNQEEAQALLNEAGKDVVYGDGIGEIGAAILFPPYAIYKLGQGAAGLAGYELDATQALPPEERRAVKEAGKAVIGAPGKVAAGIAGEEYRGNRAPRYQGNR